MIGDLGDDKLLGGSGDGDEVAGSLGIDTLSGGPGNFDFVHGDYGYDRMDGGPGKGDIASFATDVGAGRSGGVKVSLAKHRAEGDGHDRLFRFESLEGSAFDDILIGNGQSQRDRRRRRQRRDPRRRRPGPPRRRPGKRPLPGRQGPHDLLRTRKRS